MLAALGTVHHAEVGIFEVIIEAVAGEPIDVVAAIGRGTRTRCASALPPPNVRIDRFVLELAGVLEETTAFITHGGFNSTKEALLLGIPLVVIPIGGDQPYTANAWWHSDWGAA